MTLQPDDPRPSGQDRHEGAAGHNDGRPHGQGPQPADPDGPVRPGETTEPVWVLPAIVLGLLALSGSLMLWVVVCVVALVLWLMSVPPSAPPDEGRGSFGYPLGGPFGSGGIMP